MIVSEAVLVVILLLIAFGLAIMTIYFAYQISFSLPMFHGPVFVPSADDRLATMLKLAKVKKKEKCIDLGSGDGKICFALAKQGFKCEGIEINPLLVNRANRFAKKLGLSNLVTFERGNFWERSYEQYDVVFLYGTTYIMKKLEKKLLAELKPGARVISNYFQFPNWQPEKSEDEVRVYRV